MTASRSGKAASDPEEMERLANQASMTHLSSNSKQITADSDHEINVEQPALVANAIREVMDAITKKKRLDR